MDESGEVVKPALPHYLPQPAIDGREPTRLDLAQWLVSRDNPLTARTAMNRLWKQFFGAGLSKVLNDLGAQGEPPANPALLDWLACEFMDSGWDMKHMVRTIVTSATYRQVSTATPELMAADPVQPRVCPAERVAAGRGTRARHGAGRFRAARRRDRRSEREAVPAGPILGEPQLPHAGLRGRTRATASIGAGSTSGGSGRSCTRACWPSTRRAVRSAPPSAVARTFPQQALVLLNDPTYVEAARSLRRPRVA